MESTQGLIFGVINLVGNFGAVFVDQMAAGPRTASASHAAARGRAFLASVPQ